MLPGMEPSGPTGPPEPPPPVGAPAGEQHGPGARVWPVRARPGLALAVGLVAWAVTYVLAFVLRVVPLWPAMAVLAAVCWWAAWTPDVAARLRPTGRLAAVGLVTGLALGAVFAAGALVAWLTPLRPLVDEVVGLVGTGVQAPLIVLVIVVGTSPGEELLWRGAVFAALAGRLGRGWRPVLVTALLYACFVGLSGSPALTLAALVCGLVWARQRQVTGSLVPCIVGHATWGALLYTLLVWLPELRGTA
jgi:membrane protease YdiL (CAAX protease family)